jgi:Ala-tRNA(Pro) deacylase
MAISQRLKAFLNDSKVRYTAMQHPVVYTAQEIAAAQHVPGRQLAKCVLVKTDRGPILAVLSAIYRIDLKRLKTAARAKTAGIAKEADIKAQFPDVEVGAMSPFGNLYQVPVVVERILGESEEIVFNAGTHTDTIKMRYRDFAALVKPKVGAFGQTVEGKPAGSKPRAKAGKAKRTAKRPARPKSASGRRRSPSKKRR